MNRRSIIQALTRLCAAAMVLVCMSCSKVFESDVPQSSSDKEGTDVRLRVVISHPNAKFATRAQQYDDLTFTANEAAVSNLVTFIVDVDEDGNETYGYDEVEKIITDIEPSDFDKGFYVLQHELKLAPGKKHIYVGANMKSEHIVAFCQNVPLALEGSGEAVNMVMTPDPTFSGLGTDIAMFGQMSMTGSEEEKDITISEDIREYDVSGSLERLTAKVLLTVNEGEPGLVVSGGNGWIQTSDMRYTLNTTNRQTYVNRHRDEENRINIDPNWKMGDYISASGTEYTAKDGYGLHFDNLDYSTGDIMERLFDEKYSTTPLKYEDAKVGEGNSPDHYTEGLYCLENTAFNDMGLTGNNTDLAALHTTTHMVIAVRFIPKTIYTYAAVSDPENNDPVRSTDEVDPLTLDNVFTKYLVKGNGHQEGTYWTKKETNGELRYYGYAAKERLKQLNPTTVTEDDFTCYEGGWSYFTTFIDGDTDENSLKISYSGKDCWGVQRDHYYILAIDKITHPGSPIPSWTDFIRINSYTTDWSDRGSQEVNISPTE